MGGCREIIVSAVSAARSQRFGKEQNTGVYFLTTLILCAALAVSSRMGLGQNASPQMPPSFDLDLAAAKQGDIEAELRVGKSYYFGANAKNGKKNPDEACKWFERALEKGSKEAGAWVGRCYVTGHGVPLDVTRGAVLIRSAADANEPVGLRFLGLMYLDGAGVPKDTSQALVIFSRAAALHDPFSLDWLGRFYLRGNDTRKAVPFLKEAAQLGDQWAELRLGELYEAGDGTSLAKDLPLALKFYIASAMQGNATAAYKAGIFCENGTGTQQDSVRAVQFYQDSASRGFARAEFALGNAEERGLGTPVNLTDAYAWYSLAADQGNSSAYEHVIQLTSHLGAEQVKLGQARSGQLKAAIEQ
jgi:TPR repeat protein